MKNSGLWTALQHLKFKLVVAFKPRKNRTNTSFYRFVNQYDVLVDKVVPFLGTRQNTSDNPVVEIIMFGCSTGAEPYSLSAVLLKRLPHFKFKIRAFDLVPKVIARAQQRDYTKEAVHEGLFTTEAFIQETFTVTENGMYRVKEEIAAPVTFAVGNLLDEALISSLGQADIVMAQNMLFHLKPNLAKSAFGNLIRLLKNKSALFIDGMDTDMRIELTKKFNLEPVNYKIEEVHQDAFADRGNSWASNYWGREPFSTKHKEWIRKFCTVYLRNEA